MKKFFILSVLICSLVCREVSADVRIAIESSKVCHINYRLPSNSFNVGDKLVLQDLDGNILGSIVLDESGVIFFENAPFGKYLIQKVDEDKYIPIIMDINSLDDYHISKIIDYFRFYSKDDALKLLGNNLDIDNTYEEISKVIEINKSENILVNKLPITGEDNYGGYFAIVLLSLGFFLVKRKK